MTSVQFREPYHFSLVLLTRVQCMYRKLKEGKIAENIRNILYNLNLIM